MFAKLRAKIRALFTPSEVDVVLPDPNRAQSKMGLKLIAIDAMKTRWILVEGCRGARCNHDGAWFLPSEHMNESFVFTFDEGKKMAIVQSTTPDEVEEVVVEG